MTIRLGHVCLATPRLEEMIAFYCEHLDCRVAHEFKNERGDRYGAFLAVGDGTFLELFNADPRASSGEYRADSGRFRHLAFQVESVAAIAARFAHARPAPEVTRGRTDRALQCWVLDPDGNQIEFHEYDEQCVQHAHLPARDHA